MVDELFENARRSLPRFEEVEEESAFGTIQHISGPIVVAKKMRGVAVHELVLVGGNELLGEVRVIEGDTATIQIFDDTGSLRVGDMVLRTGHPLLVELGPGLTMNGFDGIQRPIQAIGGNTHNIFLPTGGSRTGLDKNHQWLFQPLLKVGDLIQRGDVYGTVVENAVFKVHKIMFPLLSKGGRITFIASSDNYTLEDPILEVESLNGEKKTYTMLQTWPVRQPRPVTEKVPADAPLVTGLRVLDALFPCVQGGTVIVPALYGGGMRTLLQGLVKFSNSDFVTYVSSGMRSSDTMEIIDSLRWITVHEDNNESLMKKTTLLADATNVPVAIREVSIYTGVVIAEYVRDMGYNSSLIVDSTGRWIEALEEISSRFSEVPDEFGYPVDLSSRLVSFYGRAGKVNCIGSPSRKGSLTIIGATACPSSSDSVRDTLAEIALGTTQTFWCLDPQLSRRKHFPAVNWHRSHSRELRSLDEFYSTSLDLDVARTPLDSSGSVVDFVGLRTKCQDILKREDELSSFVAKFGKDRLKNTESFTLEVAQLIREDFLQQNIFSQYDRYCPLYKTTLMLKNIVDYYDWGIKTLEKTSLSWPLLKKKLEEVNGVDLAYELSTQKFQAPEDGRDSLSKFYKALNRKILTTYDLILSQHP